MDGLLNGYSKARRKYTRRTGCYGAALVELAFVLPFMLLLSAAVVELGNALTQYLLVVQVTSEGVRLAGKTPGLEVATFSRNGQNSESCSTSSLCPAHASVASKVFSLLAAQDSMLHLQEDTTVVSSAYSPLGSAPYPRVTISVTANIPTFFNLFGPFEVRVEEDGPWLLGS